MSESLFGPERVRGAFGVIYEIERLGYVNDSHRGMMLEARFRLPGQQTWDVGLFELAKLEELPALREAA